MGVVQVPRAWGDRRLAWGVASIAIAAAVAAAATRSRPEAPVVSGGDRDQVLAQVEPASAAERAELARARAGDRAVAVKLALRYVEHGRKLADPRYHGRAQAVLARWWREPTPPDDVLFLRATIRQAIHDFAAARADLDLLITRDPTDPNARLTRAAVAAVTGDLATAATDCASLVPAGELVVLACAAPIVRAGGDLGAAYDSLERALAAAGSEMAPGVAVWAWTSLGELARQRGDDPAAERAFQAALSIEPANTYGLAQLADLYLDHRRDADAADLLRGAGEADNLLLRLAIAEHRLGDRAAAIHTRLIKTRLDAGIARGDYTHQREYARLLLDLVGDARGALRAALDNWQLQKELVDGQLVLEAAAAAGDPGAAAAVIAWHDQHQVRDALIDRARARLEARR
jgi:tetratricopeptide (TPR) repeat protein